MSKNFFGKFKYFISIVSLSIFGLTNSYAQLTSSSSPATKDSGTDYLGAANNSISGLGKLIQNVNTNIGGNLVLLLSSAAFILFLWGLVRFIFDRSNGDDKRLEKDKEAMGWGLVALFILISVWGIIKMFQGFLGIQNSGNIVLPKLCVNGTCDTSTGAVTPAGGLGKGPSFNDPTKKLDVNTTKVDGTYNIDSIRSWQNNLREGMGSPNGTNEIAQLQKFLKEHNYAGYLGTTGPNQDGVDGIFGPATTAAVMAFQKDNALAQDGVVGNGTRAVILYRHMNAQPDFDTYHVGTWQNIITTGSTDSNTLGTVSELQQFLKYEGYDLGTTGPNKDGIDGIYGGKTAQAVVNFQYQFYLKEDNLVGPSTKAVIMFVENHNK